MGSAKRSVQELWKLKGVSACGQRKVTKWSRGREDQGKLMTMF